MPASVWVIVVAATMLPIGIIYFGRKFLEASEILDEHERLEEERKNNKKLRYY